MADRPYVSFAEVKQKVPIPDVLEKLGIADRFQRKNDQLTGICPLPSHKHGPNPNPEQFKINRKDGGLFLWHCFGDCQKGGDVIELVKEITGYDDAHVRFWFAEKFGDRLTLSKPKGEKSTDKKPKSSEMKDKEPEKNEAAEAAAPGEQPAAMKPLRFHLNLKADVPYLLEERGLTPETIKRYGIGLCNRGVLKDYIAIPVYQHPRELSDNPLAYLGRWPGEDYDEAADRPRYKWPKDFLKSQVVYGLTEALEQTQGRPLIVVEGPFKVYHLFQAGFPNTVAIFGSSMSDEQATHLVTTGRPLILFFDGNEAGRAGMRMAAGKLIAKTFVRVVKLQEGTEPDHLSAEQLTMMLS